MSEEVLSLTDSEIALLKDNPGVVLFHMDGCGHCVSMMPEWNRVITELKDGMKNEIILGAVERNNIEKFHKHGIKPNVNGFPTVLYFHPSKLHNPEVYNKDRSYEEFKRWIIEKSHKGKGKGKGKGKNNNDNNADNKVMSAIKNYDKYMKHKSERFMGNNNEIVVGQEGGGRRRRDRSRRNRVKRLRRTRKHRRTHRRRTHCKSRSKLDVKSGGGCGCGSSGRQKDEGMFSF